MRPVSSDARDWSLRLVPATAPRHLFGWPLVWVRYVMRPDAPWASHVPCRSGTLCTCQIPRLLPALSAVLLSETAA